MENTQRKASEVILELETKLDIILGIIRTQDLNIKILSNKLNNAIELLEKKAPPALNTVEAVVPKNDDRNIKVSSEFNLQIETAPKGFRRTSRPETFDRSEDFQEAKSIIAPKFPTVPSKEADAEVSLPPVEKVKASPKTQNMVQNAIPVSQRVVNKDGKSLFLADVEVIDLGIMESVFKTRTNGTGKWSASLGVGNYRIIINKRESSTTGKLEATQDIKVGPNDSKLDLQTIIIKS